MKKFITFVLTAAMAVSALGVTVFADDAATADSTTTAAPTEDDKADAEAPTEGDKADAEAPTEGDKADAEAPTEGDKADAEEPTEGDKADAEEPTEGDKADAEEPTEGEDAEDPAPLDASEKPAEPAAPVAPPAEKAKAVPTNAKVVIDGKEVAFAAYNIGGNNYFKLRDLAAALDGTDAEFDVVYDTALKAIKLTKKGSATPDVYTGDGKIDATVVPGAKEAKLSTQRIILPTGAWLDATDAKMTGYNIGGYNYFKLREVADVIIFKVDWDKEAKVITITTDDLTAAAPTDDTTAPADDTKAPADDTTAPADDTKAPADDTTAPADDTTAPADDTKAPADDTTAPADDAKDGVGDVAPVDPTAPADDAEPQKGL